MRKLNFREAEQAVREAWNDNVREMPTLMDLSTRSESGVRGILKRLKLNLNELRAGATAAGGQGPTGRPMGDGDRRQLMDAVKGSRHPSLLPRHSTCGHLTGDIDRAVGDPVIYLGQPEMVYEPLSSTDGQPGVVGASKIGTTRDALSRRVDVLMAHERDTDGVDRYPNSGTELTAYHFAMPSHPGLTSDDVTGQPDTVAGVVVARSLAEASEAIAGVRPAGTVEPHGEQWDTSRCRFSDRIDRYSQMIDESRSDADGADLPFYGWNFTPDTTAWWLAYGVPDDECPIREFGVALYEPRQHAFRQDRSI